MGNTPTVSVIIPVYNVSDYIGDCLESLLRQSYGNIEVILVDDRTPDDSMRVAAPYIDRLKERFEVIVVTHEKNKGVSAARNSGVRASAGEWLFFLDSDDRITDGCIGSLVSLTGKYPDVDFVAGNIEVVGSDVYFPLRLPEYLSGNDKIFTEFINGGWYVMPWNKLIRRDYFVNNSLWFEERIIHEDELFSFYMAATASAVACTQEKTYEYIITRAGSITSVFGIRNMEANLKVNTLRFGYLLENSARYEGVPIYKHVVDCAFGFILGVIPNCTIDNKTKKALVRKQVKLLRSASGLKRPAGRRILVKRVILNSPFFAMKMGVRMVNRVL